MKIQFLQESFDYTGKELRPLFIYEKGIKGSALVAWQGSCHVKTEDLVDAEDKVKSDFIKSENMLHFVGEFFHKDIFYGIFVQRFFAETVKNYLNEKTDQTFERKGDDVYCGDKKLNVSIATVGRLSSLIHFGVNISSKNTPVPTIGLEDLGLDSKAFANEILQAIKAELDSIEQASMKVLAF